MFIELTEILRCPRPHEQSYVICVPMEMNGRDVVRGGISCPVCSTDYPIIDGVVRFSAPEAVGRPQGPPLEAATLLGLDGPGGYVLLIGSAARLADSFRGIHVVALNAAGQPSPSVSHTWCRDAVPLRARSVRGAVVGADCPPEEWIPRAADAVLPGLRLIAEDEAAPGAGLTALARGAGVTVFQK